MYCKTISFLFLFQLPVIRVALLHMRERQMRWDLRSTFSNFHKNTNTFRLG